MQPSSSGAPTQSQAEFAVKYDGDDLRNHLMPVRELAPALIALGEMFERANTILNGETAQVSLDIRATKEGSFEIGLLLRQVIETAPMFPDAISLAADLKTIVIGGGTVGSLGAFGVIKRFRGKRIPEPTPASPEEGEGLVVLEYSNNVKLTIPASVAKVASDQKMRELVAAVAAPLRRDGISELAFQEDGKTVESLSEDEATELAPPLPMPEEQSNEIFMRGVRLRATTINFEPDRKWRLSDGAAIGWYSIEDKAFKERIADGRTRLGNGDVFVCDVARITTGSGNRSSIRYEIRKVHEHYARDPGEPIPMPLPFDEP